MSKNVRIAKKPPAKRPEPSALPGPPEPGAEAPRPGACHAEAVAGVLATGSEACPALDFASGRGVATGFRFAGGADRACARARVTFGFEDGMMRSWWAFVRPACRGAGAAAVSARRVTTAGDPSFEGTAGVAAWAVVGAAAVRACPEAIATGVSTRTEASRPFFVPACADAEPAGVEAFARTCTGVPVDAPPADALVSTPVPPTDAEASVVAETGVPGDETSTAAPADADGVETSTLASPSLETSAETDVDPTFTETEMPGFFGGDEPAAALWA